MNLYECIICAGVVYQRGQYWKALLIAENTKEARQLMYRKTGCPEWLASNNSLFRKLGGVSFKNSEVIHGEKF